MASRDRKTDETAGKPGRTGKQLQIWIPAPLRDALDAATKTQRRPLTTEVIIALEEHLAKLGLWPPAEAQEPAERRTRPKGS